MANEKIALSSQMGVASQLLRNVYWWMTGALCITALSALLVISRTEWIASLIAHHGMFYVLLGAELALVLILSSTIDRLSIISATVMFLIYSILNGVTLSSILIVYTKTSVAGTFFITAGMFATMATIGHVTQRDLSGIGRFALMALIGLIIASIVNIFLGSTPLYWIISFAGVLIFAGLTAYDAQKIKAMLDNMDEVNDTTQKIALMGALTLYLDFINLFLHLLRIFGRRS